jgi:superfamily II DNA or RNA helicase
MVELYADQMEIVSELRESMRTHKNILLQSPTGSGKTAMAIWMITQAIGKSRKIAFTVPRRELLKQTSQSFEANGIEHGFIASGKPYNPYCQVYSGMIDTMARRVGSLPYVDVLFVDETHFGEGSLNKVIADYKRMGSWIIGLSATPWKLSGKGLGCYYDHMVVGKSMRWLIDNKRLSDYRLFAGREKTDFSGISTTAGDYAKGELASFMEEKKVIIGDCVSAYKERAMGKLHITRCASIKHSQMTAQAYRDAGVTAVHVDGTKHDNEMRQIIRAYAKREIQVLTFCDLLNFGFDLSQASGMDVCIESGSDLKPSMSLAGQMQFWGRMLRYKPEPAIIIDHVNNHEEHGVPCAERDWTLEDREQKKRKAGEKREATKQCDNCFYVHAPAPMCPECGHKYKVNPRTIDVVEGELQEVDKFAAMQKKKQARIEQGQAQNLDQLIALGVSRGYENPRGWAMKVYNARKR